MLNIAKFGSSEDVIRQPITDMSVPVDFFSLQIADAGKTKGATYPRPQVKKCDICPK